MGVGGLHKRDVCLLYLIGMGGFYNGHGASTRFYVPWWARVETGIIVSPIETYVVPNGGPPAKRGPDSCICGEDGCIRVEKVIPICVDSP